MENPFATRKIPFYIYWSILIFLGTIQAVFNVMFEMLPLGVAVIDALVFGAIIGVLGLAVWYVVRYNDLEDVSVLQIISSHIAAALLIAISWVYFSGFIAELIVRRGEYGLFLAERRTGRFVAGLLFYVILASTYYLFILYKRNQEKLLHETKLHEQVREAQLRALKSQINPHFLFNSLNSIASLTLADPEKAHEMVIALSGFMRYSLRRHNGDLVTLNEELDSIALYLQIEKIRFGEKLNYHFDVEEGCKKCLIPNLVLQPLFENAIKYGVYEASEPIEIRLTARKSVDFMEIAIENDFDPESFPAKGEGVGLKNVQERLRIIFGSNNLLKTEKGENRFTVKLYIPCDGNENS